MYVRLLETAAHATCAPARRLFRAGQPPHSVWGGGAATGQLHTLMPRCMHQPPALPLPVERLCSLHPEGSAALHTCFACARAHSDAGALLCTGLPCCRRRRRLPRASQALMLRDVQRVATMLVVLKACYPCADVSRIVAVSPRTLLKDAATIEADARVVRGERGAQRGHPPR